MPLSATYRLGESLIDNKWPKDLCVYTIRFFPERAGKSLPSLSFIAPFSTGNSICNHIHEENTLIDYLRDKERADHICPLCKIGAKRLKLESSDPNEWKRPDTKGTEKTFTTEIFTSQIKGLLTPIEMKGMAKFCNGLQTSGESALKNRQAENQDIIIAYDITNDKRGITGFAMFNKGIDNRMRIDTEKLKEIFDQLSFKIAENDWEKASEFILDYILDEREYQYDVNETEKPGYKKELETVYGDLKNYLVGYQGSLDEIAEWMLTVDSEKVEEEGIGILFIHLICVDSAFKKMGISKGIFRGLRKEVVEWATKKEFVDARMRLQPVDESVQEMYEAFGFKEEESGEMITPNLLEKKLSIENY